MKDVPTDIDEVQTWAMDLLRQRMVDEYGEPTIGEVDDIEFLATPHGWEGRWNSSGVQVDVTKALGEFKIILSSYLTPRSEDGSAERIGFIAQSDDFHPDYTAFLTGEHTCPPYSDDDYEGYLFLTLHICRNEESEQVAAAQIRHHWSDVATDLLNDLMTLNRRMEGMPIEHSGQVLKEASRLMRMVLSGV